MSKYKCPFCKFSTDKKYDYDRHKNRKNPCIIMKDDDDVNVDVDVDVNINTDINTVVDTDINADIIDVDNIDIYQMIQNMAAKIKSLTIENQQFKQSLKSQK